MAHAAKQYREPHTGLQTRRTEPVNSITKLAYHLDVEQGMIHVFWEHGHVGSIPTI